MPLCFPPPYRRRKVKEKRTLPYSYHALWAPLEARMVKNPPAMQETRLQSLGWEDPLEKRMATHSVFLPGEFHGQKSLVSYSP